MSPGLTTNAGRVIEAGIWQRLTGANLRQLFANQVPPMP